MNNNKNLYAKLIPVMLCFFAMGFVDLVGIASNYVKVDLNLTDAQANIFPSLVFFWFLIFSVPTGILMNKIGRKKTVLLSLAVTFASLLIPVFGDGYVIMLLSFSLLGIGNALMQTSLNPLLSNIITGDKLASTLTFGQFVKAIASFLAPYKPFPCSYLAYLVRFIFSYILYNCEYFSYLSTLFIYLLTVTYKLYTFFVDNWSLNSSFSILSILLIDYVSNLFYLIYFCDHNCHVIFNFIKL